LELIGPILVLIGPGTKDGQRELANWPRVYRLSKFSFHLKRYKDMTPELFSESKQGSMQTSSTDFE
jgi:hypothetical protein